MDITKLSSQYTVRKLTANDVECIYALAAGNPLFYRFCPPFVTRRSILRDMEALPPRTVKEDKFYIGFFQETKLMAVMDLILNYPDTQTAFLGFFMMRPSEQGKGIGSKITEECFACLWSGKYRFVRLAYAKGNPQSEAFWKKNGFTETGTEKDCGNYTAVVMERELQDSKK